MPGSLLGTEVVRVEDPDLLEGKGTFIDNLAVPGLLHLAFVRSPFAHALINDVDATEAMAVPGVVATFTNADLGLPPFHSFGMALNEACARPPLAEGKAHFVGDPVVAVVAETAAAAADGAQAVVVDYEPLDAVVDMEEALAPGAPIQFEAIGSNLAAGLRDPAGVAPLDDAEVVVRGRFVNQRIAVVPMEGNAIAVLPKGSASASTSGRDGETPELTVYVSTQMPHLFRRLACGLLGLEEDAMRVITPHVGGGFGGKAGITAEHAVALVVARHLGRPVKWVETRSENLVALPHGRSQVQYVEMGFTREGSITGMRASIVGDAGAYGGFGGGLAMGPTRMMAQGVYRIPKIVYDVAVAVTNTTPVGAFRGAGRPEAAAFLERIMDMAADELGLDPIEIRRRNLVAPDQFPYTTLMGTTYDVGDYDLPLRLAVERAGYDALLAEQAGRRQRGDRWQLGVGVSTYVEVTAGGMSSEYGAVEVGEDGIVTVKVGTSSHGQGHATSFAMLVADRLHVPLESIRFVQSDTALVPRGGGTGGSRSLQIGGSAVYAAAEAVVDRARRLAARLLEADEDDIVVTDDGHVGVAGVPARALSWAELAQAAGRDGDGTSGGRPRHHPERSELPLRRSHRRRGGRRRDRPGAPPPPRGGRRLRPHRQPAPREGPAARRHRPRRRPGAVGGVRLRRGRQPAHVDPRRVRHAERGRAPLVRDGQHRDADTAEPTGCQGDRGVGDHRLHAGRAERGGRRAEPPRRAPHRHALHPAAGLAGHHDGPGRR